MDGGLLEGTTEQERVKRWGQEWKTLELGLENNDSGRLRGCKAIEEVAALHPGQRVLVVSHGAILRSTLGGLVPGLDLSRLLKNTSLTRIVKDGETWTCELYNCVKHHGESAG
ncbi:hypothetical protein D3C80_1808600 [compost metagenome]